MIQITFSDEFHCGLRLELLDLDAPGLIVKKPMRVLCPSHRFDHNAPDFSIIQKVKYPIHPAIWSFPLKTPELFGPFESSQKDQSIGLKLVLWSQLDFKSTLKSKWLLAMLRDSFNDLRVKEKSTIIPKTKPQNDWMNRATRFRLPLVLKIIWNGKETSYWLGFIWLFSIWLAELISFFQVLFCSSMFLVKKSNVRWSSFLFCPPIWMLAHEVTHDFLQFALYVSWVSFKLGSKELLFWWFPFLELL